MSTPNEIERVYKYLLPLLGEWFSMTMPEGAIPLCRQVQDGQPCMWARIVVGRPPVTHHFRLAGTGHSLQSSTHTMPLWGHGGLVGQYVGSA